MATTTKEVAKRDSGAGALALPDGYMDAFPEGYEDSDHVLPVFSIVQPTSQPDKKALGKEGTFVSRGGTNYATIRFVLIWMQYTRAKQRPYDGDGPMFFCRSDDRRLGETENPGAFLDAAWLKDKGVVPNEPTTIPCESCPLFEDEIKRVKDGCRHGYTLRGWDLDAQRPFAYFVRGTAMSQWRAVIADKVTPRTRADGTIILPEHPFWFAELEFTTVHRREGGSWYVPVPRVVREFDDAEMAEYASMAPVVRKAAVEDPEERPGQKPMLPDN